MIKTAETIQKGDIFRTEYGDYDNWCNFIFISCEPDGEKWTKITVQSINTTEVFSMYENNPINKVTFNVIENFHLTSQF